MIPRRAFRALAHQNFRLFCIGQGISLVGTWAQQVAAAWLVYQLTGSPFWLGVVAFAGQVPAFFLAPLAGVFVDRWPRKAVLLATQTLAMLQAFALAALALTGVVAVWQIVVLSGFLGVVTAFDMTARQVFLPELVKSREDTANAVALNSSLVNVARLIGPALAGFMLAHAGAGICFLINGVSYIAVLVVLFLMTMPRRREMPQRGHVWGELADGLRYAFGFQPIRALILLLGIVSMAGAAQTTLLPVIAAGLPGGGADTFGLLAAASGVGALAAALALAMRVSVVGLGRWVALAPGVLGVGLLGLSLAGSVYWAAVALALAGFALMTHMAASNTILQTIADETKRGRVMSLYAAAFLGAAPLGSLAAGALAGWLGLAHTLWIASAVCVAASAGFALRLARLRELVRPIYLHLGIMPEPGPAAPATPVLVLPTHANPTHGTQT